MNFCWFLMILVKFEICGQIFWFMEAIFGVIFLWETDKLPKKILKSTEKITEIILDILNNALSWKMSVIFPIKLVLSSPLRPPFLFLQIFDIFLIPSGNVFIWVVFPRMNSIFSQKSTNGLRNAFLNKK